MNKAARMTLRFELDPIADAKVIDVLQHIRRGKRAQFVRQMMHEWIETHAEELALTREIEGAVDNLVWTGIPERQDGRFTGLSRFVTTGKEWIV